MVRPSRTIAWARARRAACEYLRVNEDANTRVRDSVLAHFGVAPSKEDGEAATNGVAEA